MTREIFHVFATFAVGGPQARFATLANALGKRYRHTILAMDGNYAAAERLGAEVDYRLRTDIACEKRRTLKNILAFRRILADERPDLLITSNWGSMEWAMANRPSLVPHLHMEDGFGPEEAAKQIGRRAWFRRVALKGKEVVVASKTLEAIALGKWRIAPERLRFIANGVDARRFARAADPALFERLGDPADGPLIGTVAGLRAEKNLPRLVDAFAAINAKTPARLAIVGEGPERAAVEAHAQSLDVRSRVFLPGYVADPAVILGAFDLFMMASDTEQAPVSLLEAMAAGLAVAATDVGDISDMVAAENRPCIVPASASALAEAGLALLSEDGLRKRLGEANRARCAEVYAEAIMIERWRALWDGDFERDAASGESG